MITVINNGHINTNWPGLELRFKERELEEISCKDGFISNTDKEDLPDSSFKVHFT